jgi:D-alanine-D-alanine ligase
MTGPNLNTSGSAMIAFRERVQPSDIASVQDIVTSSGFFSSDEVEMAVQLVKESLRIGSQKSGYYFLFAELAGKVIGYACFGPIACTLSSFDLYWIAVHNAFRSAGFGKELLQRCECLIEKQQGRRIYVETSSRELYLPTHQFYSSCGYKIEAVLKQFYSPQDDKIIYVKVLH